WGAFAVVRLNANGTPDTSFGTGGRATINFGESPHYDAATGVAVDAVGRIVLAGYTNANYNGASYDFAVTRLNADGSLDTSFASGGKTIINIGTDIDGNRTYDLASGVALDSLGWIVVVGSSGTPASYYGNEFSMVRLKGDGSLDAGFGNAGKA